MHVLVLTIKLYEYNLVLKLSGSINYTEYASVSKKTLMERTVLSVVIKQHQSERLKHVT